MKKCFLLLLLVGLSAGCAPRYVIVLNNNNRITATSKPKLRGGNYYFKDAQGQEGYVPAGRVKEIAPESMATEEKTLFKPQSR